MPHCKETEKKKKLLNKTKLTLNEFNLEKKEKIKHNEVH